MSINCKPIVSRKFIKVDGTRYDVLLGDGTVKDLRDLETFHGEHIMSGETCTTINLLNFLESWGAFENTGSSIYIKETNTVIPDIDTGIGDIPLRKALIITYHVDGQTLIWLHSDEGTVYKYRNHIWSVDSLDPSFYISINDVGTIVPGLDDNGILDPSVLPNIPQEIIYGFDLNALNALENKSSEILYIDLNTRIQYYWNGTEFAPYTTSINFADKSEAELGVITTKVMAPKTTKDAINYHKSPSNIVGSTNLTNLTTSNTGTSDKIARQDHSHKITGFALTNHTHPRILSRDVNTDRIVDMDTGAVINIDATTLGGWNRNQFATIIQGNKADTAIQDVTIGGFSYKNGTTAILPRYPVNSDFKLVHLSDFPEDFVENKVLVTNVNGGFELKDYVTTFNYENSTNLPSISLDNINPTQLSSTPYTLKGNLKLHPIVTSGTISSLNDINFNTLEENNILQYKGGFWVNAPLESSLGNLSNLTFNNLGSGVTPNSSYNGSSSVIVSYNTVGAAPISHNHTLVGLSDVLLNNLETNNTLSYNGSKWVNIPKYQPSNLTFNNSGSGAVSGTVYNGNTNLSISYNTIGAASNNHSHNLNDLNNVVISNPVLDQALTYNGINWINTTISGGGSTTMFPYNMAFVHSNGDDNTAEVGNINKPFATLQEAIDAVKSTDFPVIQIMSDLTLNTPITTPTNKDIIINLYNGVTINFTNSLHGSSLFTIYTNVSITLISNGSSKFICESGTYLSSFATLRMGTLKLQNINVIHNINTNFSTNSTIFCDDQPLLQMDNCYIQTNSFSTDSSVQCSNIRSSQNHIIELINTKLVITNNATGGLSRHIIDVDTFPKTSLINCKTIQILPNFVNPTEDPTSSYTTGWGKIGVAGAETNRATTHYTISNCIFYINNVVQTRLSSSWVRFKVWPNTRWYVDRPESLAHVFQIKGIDNIEYLGTSLHNYGKTFGNDEIVTPPTQYGGVFATSLVRCDLNQPFELLM